MKQIAILCLVVMGFFSCKKEDTSLLVLPLQNLTFSVDATIQPPLTYYIPINSVTTNAVTIIEGQGVDTANIKRIIPKSARLSIVFANAKLDFIDAVSIRLCSLGDNKENCGREVFYRDPVPFNTGSDLNLVPSNIDDISDILLADKVNVQVKLERLRDFPQGAFEVVLDMNFEVQ